ncbi:MAG: hypothetical protein AVDCRST_MAG93-1925, partial [uncultured Chloroflexia bacterium]
MQKLSRPTLVLIAGVIMLALLGIFVG